MVMSLNLCKKKYTYTKQGSGHYEVSAKQTCQLGLSCYSNTYIISRCGQLYFIAKSELDATGQMGLKNGASAIISMITELDKQVEKGNLTLDEAQEQARVQIVGQKTDEKKRSNDNPVKFGDNFYFYTLTDNGFVEAHPNIEGDNAYDLQTDDGRYYIRELIDVAKDGGGFVSYDWPLPTNPNKKAPKITYVSNG